MQKERLNQQGVHDAKILKLIAVLHRSAIKVCHGQTLDHRGEHSAQDVRQFKTAPLFIACVEVIDVLYELDHETISLLFRLAELLGDYFQRRDDFLDRFGLDSERGRSGSSDSRNKKHTEASAIPMKDLRDRLNLSEQELIKTSAMLAQLREGTVEFFESVLKELSVASLGYSNDDIQSNLNRPS
jgi:geranylgeranyl pyrophosphate synthase